MTEITSRKRGRRGSPESWSVDAHVGQRVRMRRTLLGISQEKLGEAIGLTFQQVQKYERGSNRISAGTLYRLGQVLDVPVSFFFDCYEVPEGVIATPPLGGVASSASNDGGGISRREARLLRLWRDAPDPIASEVLALLSSLVAEPALPDEGNRSGDVMNPQASNAPPSSARASIALAPTDAPSPAIPPPGKKGRRRHGAVWDPTDIVNASYE